MEEICLFINTHITCSVLSNVPSSLYLEVSIMLQNYSSALECKSMIVVGADRPRGSRFKPEGGEGGCFAPDCLPSSLYRSPLVELSGDGYMRRDGVEWGKWGHAQREKSSLLLLI